MDNLELYNKVRQVPKEAQRAIEAGRLKGKTDINPMWRIKELTEQFGPCGIGWYTEDVRKWTEQGANGEIAVFVDINLYVKMNGEWSKPIPGTGGSMLVSKEKNGLYTDDEAFKKAYTDAISVSCKALGFGSDVYWEKDPTKYQKPTHQGEQKPEQLELPDTLEDLQKMKISKESLGAFGVKNIGKMIASIENHYETKIADLTRQQTADAWKRLWGGE